MWWKWIQSCIGTAEAQGNRLYKKNTPLWSVLDDQSRVLEISSRETPERPWHRMCSWTHVCQSKTFSFGAFWKPRLETANQRPGDTETRLQLLGFMNARLRFKSYQFLTVYGAAEPEVEI